LTRSKKADSPLTQPEEIFFDPKGKIEKFDVLGKIFQTHIKAIDG